MAQKKQPLGFYSQRLCQYTNLLFFLTTLHSRAFYLNSVATGNWERLQLLFYHANESKGYGFYPQRLCNFSISLHLIAPFAKGLLSAVRDALRNIANNAAPYR